MTEKNTAQALLAKLIAQYKDSVTINVGGVDFVFNRDDAAYDAMINEVDSGNKLTPIKEYLLTIVAREQKDDLLQIIHLPGLALQVVGKVNAELVPELNLKVKK